MAILSRCSASPYSCVLLIALFLNGFLSVGMTFSIGVYYMTFLEHLQYDYPSQVSFGVSLGPAAYNFAGTVCGIVINRYGARVSGIVGGLMCAAGLISTMLSTNVYAMCLTFGILWGSGVGFCYLAAISTISRTFTKYRPLVIGIVACAGGLGGFCYPVIIRFFIRQYGWRGSLLIVGGIALNIIACASLFPRKIKERQDTPDAIKEKRSITNLHIFKNPDYIIFCISVSLVQMGRSIINVHLGAFAVSRDITEDGAALLFSTLGGANIIGNFVCGVLLGLPKCNGLITFMIGSLGVGVASCLLSVSRSYVGLHVLAGAIGFFYGGNGNSMVDMCVLFLGPECMASGMGYGMMFSAIGLISGGPAASWVYQMTGNYSSAMYLGGAVLIFGAVLILIPFLRRCRSAREATSDVALEMETPGL